MGRRDAVSTGCPSCPESSHLTGITRHRDGRRGAQRLLRTSFHPRVSMATARFVFERCWTVMETLCTAGRRGGRGHCGGRGDYRCNILVVMPSLSTEVPVLGIVTGGEGAGVKWLPRALRQSLGVASRPPRRPEAEQVSNNVNLNQI